MVNPKGTIVAKAGGVSYTLALGFSALAELQSEHGQDVLERLEPPAGASEMWMPDLAIIVSLILQSLQRHHGDVAVPGDAAGRWIVDDLILENENLFDKILDAAFPSRGKNPPKGGAARGGKRKRTAAAS
jgi:hypothetical protein